MLKTLSFCFLLCAGQLAAQPVPDPVVKDQLIPAFSSKIGDFVGAKLDASYQNRILAQDVDRLVAAFRTRTETSCWQSEFWGKWFTSAVLAYKYRPEPELKRKLDPVEQTDTEIWMAFQASFIPESYQEGGSGPVQVTLCDYASAGNTHEGHPHFRVWLPQLVDPRSVPDDY